MLEEYEHRSVLLDEAVQALSVKSDGIYVDATFGRGGHSGQILKQLGVQGRLIAVDKDPEAVAAGERRYGSDRRFSIQQGSFAMLEQKVRNISGAEPVDGVLLDLGVSSPQLDDPQRGFSFLRDGPLDMRMDPDAGLSAAEWLAGVAERELAQVLRQYGEERFAKRIARAIVAARAQAPIATTAQLAAVVSAAHPAWEKGKNPATRSFQAIRIFINGELDELKVCLQQALDLLAPGGRLAVISFHSLEDRIVKRFIRQQVRGDDYPPDLPVTAAQLNQKMRMVGRAVRASEAEVAANPRARSAVLRVAERV
ncbi:MAG: 16S rRNA (cytosine(1402)-N(4))-methyltransferase RsmH [Gammaproteobacteria bacterium]|nr:16S rRNA (cytosine(1402)-N(4))-methyltransferase RsmH [Gammaproteobacteria bacterium]